MTKQQIEHFMNEAILEGRKALPKCRPNPPVGCVIVHDNKIISRGHTNPPGQHHAEAMALDLIKNQTFDKLTMFVTLEPCSFVGRTPACANTIVNKQIVDTVYVGMIDPHTKNQGKGITILKQANINVEVGALEKEVRADLAPYLLND